MSRAELLKKRRALLLQLQEAESQAPARKEGSFDLSDPTTTETAPTQTAPKEGFGGGTFSGEAGASGTWEIPNQGLPAALRTKFNEGLTKKGSDELVGLIARGRLEPTPGRYLRLPDGTELPARTDAEAHLAFREGERQNQQAAEQHYPKLGFLADMTGEVLGDAALAGQRMVSPLYQAATGAFRGYMGAKSDNPIDQGASATLGSLLGYGFGRVPELAAAASRTPLAQAIANSRAGQATGQALMTAARWPGEALERFGVATGRRVLSGAKGLKAEEMLPDAAVREAMDSGAIVPLGTTAGASRRLTATTDQVGDEMGRVVAELEQRGVRGPNVMNVYHDLASEGARLAPGNTADAIPNLYQDQAEAIFARAGDDLRLGLAQGNDLTRNLQRAAKYGKFEETPLNEARRDVARRVRGHLGETVRRAGETAEAAGDQELAALAAQFEPLKARLSRLIPADDHAYQEANRIASRNPFSLADLLAGGSVFGATQDPIKTGTALLGAHLVRTRGPSTAAWASRGLGNLYLRGLENAPTVLGELGGAANDQSEAAAQMATIRALAQAHPAFAALLESFRRPSDAQPLEARRGP